MGSVGKGRHQGFKVVFIQLIDVEGTPVQGVAAVSTKVAGIKEGLLLLGYKKRINFRKSEVALFFQLEIGKSNITGTVLD